MSEIDYSIEYHHINCEEYFWQNTDQRLYPAVIFLANTRDDQRTDENVNTLSQMYRGLGCSCVKVEYNQAGWLLSLPAFESSYRPANELAHQLSKIIVDNDLDTNPIILHIIGGEGAFIYTEIASVLSQYITGAVVESLPNSRQNSYTNQVARLSREILASNSVWWPNRNLPTNSSFRKIFGLFLSWAYIIFHSFYVPFTGRDLNGRLKRLDPEWRELFICEPSNVVDARRVCIGRRPSLIQKKLLKFPALNQRRNNLYQQCPKQYETKIGTFLKNVCDDYVSTHGLISTIVSETDSVVDSVALQGNLEF